MSKVEWLILLTKRPDLRALVEEYFAEGTSDARKAWIDSVLRPISRT